MLNWKRIAAALLAAALVGSLLTGCSDNSEKPAPASSTSSEQKAEAPSGENSESDGQNADFDYSAGITEAGFFDGVTALDYVQLPDYRNMELPASVTELSDAAVDARIESMAEEHAAKKQVKDRAVEDGDTVNIDYVGSIDGVEFDGGNTHGAGTDVIIGVTSYIDDFLEQIIGHMPGDTFDVNVTFPDPYPNNTDLSGKDAVFVTTVNYITETEIPELTDRFVSDTWGEEKGWKTVEQMRAEVRQQMIDDARIDYLWEKIQAEAEVSEIPGKISTYHRLTLLNYYMSVAKQYGMETEDFAKLYGGVDTLDEMVDGRAEMLESNAKSSLLLQALSEDLEFRVTDEQLDAFLTDQQGVSDLAGIKDFYGTPYLRLLAREALVLNELLNF